MPALPLQLLLFFKRFLIQRFSLMPQDIGGCDIQKQEIREAVEFPLSHHEIYRQMEIDPLRVCCFMVPQAQVKPC